jgi:amidase
MALSFMYSAVEASALIKKGKLTAVQLAEAFLSRVSEREEAVQAWAYIDPKQVIDRARALDQVPRRSPLHGLPIGVKDIIDTIDMPTEYGSPIYVGHRPQWDASCVALLRKAGANIMGKTVTVEFAMRHPGKTRNPLNLAHTPGGSSSGSAAAVADGMVSLALGTQTGGSILRPAAFCGVVGLKPTFNVINRAGVKPNSESLDTVGLMARDVPDAALMFTTLVGQEALDFSEPPPPVRIGFWRTPQWSNADNATKEAFSQALPRLAKSGAQIQEINLPEAFNEMYAAHGSISDYEVVRALEYERLNFSDQISSSLMKKIRKAEKCDFDTYVNAQRCASQCRLMLADVFRNYDVLLVPSAPGEAPLGLESTGDSTFNRIWTALHVPTITVPVFKGANGLPMGAQIVAPFGEDRKLLLCANWIDNALRGA